MKHPINGPHYVRIPYSTRISLGCLILAGRDYLSSCTGSSTTAVSRTMEFCICLHPQARGILLCIWMIAKKQTGSFILNMGVGLSPNLSQRKKWDEDVHPFASHFLGY